MTLVHQGQVDSEGKLTLVNPETFRRVLRGFLNAPVDITIRRHRKSRSDRQNAYYWAVVVGMLAEFCGYTPEEMHEALKWKFLRREADGPLPTVRSTTELGTQEFEDYVEMVRMWAATDLGVVVPLPNEIEA